MLFLKNKKGFAILDILLATTLMVGLMFIFMSLQSKQAKSVTTTAQGKNLSVLMNQVLTDSPTSCGTGTHNLTDCVSLSNDFKAQLKSQGFDPSTATITIQ